MRLDGYLHSEEPLALTAIRAELEPHAKMNGGTIRVYHMLSLDDGNGVLIRGSV